MCIFFKEAFVEVIYITGLLYGNLRNVIRVTVQRKEAVRVSKYATRKVVICRR